MAVVKEWQCQFCGYFESALSICPKCGCTDPYISRVFVTPPGFKSGKTKVKDSSLKEFTDLYGLTNFTNNVSQKHDKPTAHRWQPVTDMLDETHIGGGEQKLIKELMPSAKQRIEHPIIVGKDK